MDGPKAIGVMEFLSVIELRMVTRTETQTSITTEIVIQIRKLNKCKV